jgi:hypothetical protein
MTHFGSGVCIAAVETILIFAESLEQSGLPRTGADEQLNRHWLPNAVNRHKIARQLMLVRIAEAAGTRSQTD